MNWRTDLFHKVLEARALSLVAFHGLPPHCVVPFFAAKACQKANDYWRVLPDEAKQALPDVKRYKREGVCSTDEVVC